MIILSAEDVERIHIQIIDASGGSYGVREMNAIKAIVAVQNQEVFGEVLYKSVFDKAAALASGIIGNHPFIDGNKRTGIMCALIFLELNGINMSSIDNQHLEDYAVKIATEKPEINSISLWLKNNSK